VQRANTVNGVLTAIFLNGKIVDTVSIYVNTTFLLIDLVEYARQSARRKARQRLRKARSKILNQPRCVCREVQNSVISSRVLPLVSGTTKYTKMSVTSAPVLNTQKVPLSLSCFIIRGKS
jgi:hypothetical protein